MRSRRELDSGLRGVEILMSDGRGFSGCSGDEGRRNWDLEAEGGAAGVGAGEIDLSAVGFDNVFGDGESEACAGGTGGVGDAEEFSKMRGRHSAGMPGPVSRIVKVIVLPVSWARTVTRPPAGVNFNALERRFVRADRM